MLDRYNRRITYLRVSVTERCNLRCTYCVPDEQYKQALSGPRLTFHQIVSVVDTAVDLGITKIRLTGGEPLVRTGIAELVAMLAVNEGITDLAMTTNGTLLGPLARPLKLAGLQRLNISLDTLDPKEYSSITRGGNIAHVLNGIDAAIAEGFPIKINAVRSEYSSGINDLKEYCRKRNLELQLIRQYDLAANKKDGGVYDRPSPCEECNRIRLLADGTFKPCLHSDVEIPIEIEDIARSLEDTINAKPARGTICRELGIAQIGG